MRLDDARARAARARYRDAPARTRAYVAVRLATCPFEALLDRLAPTAHLLDVGCGAGVLGHLVTASGGTAIGVDPDARKVAVARASAGDGEPFRVVQGTAQTAPAGPFDAVSLVDVLYLEPPDVQDAMLEAACGRLGDGGTILVKTVHDEARWKSRLTRAQETVAVRGLGWTQGRALTAPPPERVEATLRAHGLAVETTRVDRGYLHPHLLIEGRRAVGQSAGADS